MKTLNKLPIALLGFFAFAAFDAPMDGTAAEVTNSTLSVATNLINRTFKVDPDTFNASEAASNFFSALGVDLTMPGKNIFYNDRTGLLYVRATEQDLDIIERVLEMQHSTAPQIHIKARFLELVQDDGEQPNFSEAIGQFKAGSMVLVTNQLDYLFGMSAPSRRGPPYSAPTVSTVTGIMSDPNFRIALQALQQRAGVEMLAEPETITPSGRQIQMRTTDRLNHDYFDDPDPNMGSGRIFKTVGQLN